MPGVSRRLRIVCFKIPEDMLVFLDELVFRKRYRSRSHAIRAAIRLLLEKEYSS
jgi:Arc/MetJ-type ribon-helix-helix transcriptional regulator